MRMLTLKVQIATGRTVVVVGRAAWALLELQTARGVGCTYIANPAPRWSGYVYELRKLGFAIDTLQELHGGPFAGRHARYLLRSSITVLEKSGGQPCIAEAQNGAGTVSAPPVVKVCRNSRTITNGVQHILEGVHVKAS